MTEQPTLGGRAWPTVIFDDPRHEIAFALWANSTLGLLCHWWMSNKAQSGRGNTTIMSTPAIPTLDVRQLSDEQLVTAVAEFEAVQDNRFLPFDQLDEDEARATSTIAFLLLCLGCRRTCANLVAPWNSSAGSFPSSRRFAGGN
jgi:hypothetical protein